MLLILENLEYVIAYVKKTYGGRLKDVYQNG